MKWTNEGLERLARDVYKNTIPVIEAQRMSQRQIDYYTRDYVSAYHYALHVVKAMRMN